MSTEKIVSGHMTESYFRSIVKSISYAYDDLFSPEDIELITESTFFAANDDEAQELTTMGKNKAGAQNLETTLWQEWDNQVFHSFENIYAKLICCLGKKTDTAKQLSLDMPVYDSKNGVMIIDKRTYKIADAAKSCTFKGRNFYDDNDTSAGYEANCEALMNKYCLFLQKYDPTNPLIEELCGCILGRQFVTPALLLPENALALGMIIEQRNCGIGKCLLKSSYKRQGDRDACVSEINICTNNLNVSDIEANKASFKNIKLQNDCGGTKVAAPVNNVDIPVVIPPTDTTTDSNTDDDDDEDTTDTTTDSNTNTTIDEEEKPKKKEEEKKSKKKSKKKVEEVGFFQSIIDWFMGLFGTEGFSPKNNKFDFIYSVFSFIVLYMLVLKDPLRISKKINKMF